MSADAVIDISPGPYQGFSWQGQVYHCNRDGRTYWCESSWPSEVMAEIERVANEGKPMEWRTVVEGEKIHLYGFCA